MLQTKVKAMIYILAIVTAAALIYFFMVSKNPKGTTQTDDMNALQEKAENGDAEAQYNLAACYHTGDGVKQNITQAVKWYLESAKQGYAEAQYNLAICYAKGKGVQQNITKAIELYERAADQGHEEAIKALEEMNKLKT